MRNTPLSSFQCILAQWFEESHSCNRYKDLKYRISRFPNMMPMYFCVKMMLAYQEEENHCHCATCSYLLLLDHWLQGHLKTHLLFSKEERHSILIFLIWEGEVAGAENSRRVFFRHRYLTWQSISGAVNKTSSSDLATGRASASSRQKGRIKNPLK